MLCRWKRLEWKVGSQYAGSCHHSAHLRSRIICSYSFTGLFPTFEKTFTHLYELSTTLWCRNCRYLFLRKTSCGLVKFPIWIKFPNRFQDQTSSFLINYKNFNLHAILEFVAILLFSFLLASHSLSLDFNSHDHLDQWNMCLLGRERMPQKPLPLFAWAERRNFSDITMCYPSTATILIWRSSDKALVCCNVCTSRRGVWSC